MGRDVIVVSITRELAKGADVERATRGDWLLSTRSAERLEFIVGVSKGSVEAVYEITGFEHVGKRIRFAVRNTDRTVGADLPRMYRPFVYLSADDILGPTPRRRAAPPESAEPAYASLRLGPDLEEEPGPLRIIQFPHPGFEHRVSGKASRGVMAWRKDKSAHNRKYLRARGSYVLEPGGPVHDGEELGFWGEWEAPSSWTRITEPVGGYHPSVLHEPRLPLERPDFPLQNTDPLVLGDAFLYTNCKMGRRPTQAMPSGSLILFGRGMHVEGVPRFVLDTCFVVEHRLEHAVAAPDEMPPAGQDLLTDAVLAPLHSGKKPGQRTRIHPYLGRTPEAAAGGPFSFFPAVRHSESPKGFSRPVLEPKGPLGPVIKESLKQGMRTTWVESHDDVRKVWDEVVSQVRAWDGEQVVLGVSAEAPGWGSL